MTADAIAMSQPVYLSPDGVDITRLVRLHRRYHGKQSAITYIRALRNLRGKTSQRPDADDATIGHAWRVADAKLERERNDAKPYRGSRDETAHRSGRRLPRNGR